MGQSVAQVWSNRAWFWSLLRDDAPKRLFITDRRVRIFLLSFAMLFFELLCIRWIPSYVRYLSYFNNFILLASFLGIGLGMLAARRQRFWFPPFPLLLLLLAIVVAKNRFDLRIDSTDVLYYGAGEAQSAQAENFIVLPIVFGMVTVCFIPLARSFGRLFTEVKPLTAYTFDIIGSLVGIASFSAIAYFSLPPVIWFAVLALPLLLLSARWLAYGVQSITAVEIDPTLQKLGVQYNPDHPYSNSRVKVVINDGRNFLQTTNEHYNLFIFARPDSLPLPSSNTSLRLESFL